MNRTQNSLRNIFYGLILKLVTTFIPFVTRSVLIYYIGVEYVGLNSLFTSILTFLSLTELGFSSAVVFMLYEPVAENNVPKICALVSYIKKIYRVVGCVISVIGITLIPFLDKLINGGCPSDINIYILYAIYLFDTAITYFMFAYRSVIFTAYQRVDIISKITTIMKVLTSILQIIIIVYTHNYYLYILCNTFLVVFQNVLIGTMAKRQYPELLKDGDLDQETKKNINKKVFSLMGHRIGGTIAGSLDSIVISAFLGLTILAKYSNYYILLSTLMGIISMISQAIIPSVGNFLVNRAKEEKMHLYHKLNFAYIWGVGWATVCLYVLYQPFMEIWLGKEMLLPEITMILLCVYFYTWQFRVMGCNFKDAAGLWGEDVLKPYVMSLVNVALNLMLVQIIGLNGVLISTIVSMVFVAFPWETYVLYRKLFGYSPKKYVVMHFVYALIWIGLAFITKIICNIISLKNIYIEFATSALICCVVPNILFAIMFYKTDEFKYFLQMLTSFLKKKGVSNESK